MYIQALPPPQRNLTISVRCESLLAEARWWRTRKKKANDNVTCTVVTVRTQDLGFFFKFPRRQKEGKERKVRAESRYIERHKNDSSFLYCSHDWSIAPAIGCNVAYANASDIVGFRLRGRKRKTRCKCAVIKPGLCFMLVLLRGLVKARREPHVREERGFR